MMAKKDFNKVEKKIINSLYEINDVYEFNKLSISDICRLAQISRSNFYNYFNSKEDFLDLILYKIFDNVSIILMQDPLIQRPTIIAFLKYLHSQQKALKLLTKFHNLEQRANIFMGETIENSDVPTTNTLLNAWEHIPNHYAFNVYIASINSILFTWIEDDFYEDIELIADYVLFVVMHQDNNKK